MRGRVAVDRPHKMLDCDRCSGGERTTFDPSLAFNSPRSLGHEAPAEDHAQSWREARRSARRSDFAALSNIYLTEVDRILERAKEASRGGKYTYVEYARFADDQAILIDAYKRHDWLMAAVESRGAQACLRARGALPVPLKQALRASRQPIRATSPALAFALRFRGRLALAVGFRYDDWKREVSWLEKQKISIWIRSSQRF